MALPTSDDDAVFELENFLPFILNQHAETIGKAFQQVYRNTHGITRTQWRVIAIVGRYNDLTAKDIGTIAHEEKSRISRAVSVLVSNELLARQKSAIDKREEILRLTDKGKALYDQLGQSALKFDQHLRDALGTDGEKTLLQLLETISKTARLMEL